MNETVKFKEKMDALVVFELKIDNVLLMIKNLTEQRKICAQNWSVNPDKSYLDFIKHCDNEIKRLLYLD